MRMPVPTLGAGDPMRKALIGSAIVHVALSLALFLFRMPVKVIVPGPDVVQVALIEPGAAPSVAPSRPAPPPPVEEEGVRIEPQRPRSRPQPPRPEPPRASPPPRERPAETPATARPGMALPSARVGVAGLSGSIGADHSDFQFAYYLQAVRDKVAANWSPPTGLVAGGQLVRAVVYFRIRRDGTVSGIRLETGSGAEYFDRSAVRAVTVSDRMPPLPTGFAGAELGVHFGFEWVAP